MVDTGADGGWGWGWFLKGWWWVEEDDGGKL